MTRSSRVRRGVIESLRERLTERLKKSVYSTITSNMVFEHLKHPESQLAEIHRILKPGGMLVFHTPNANGYLTKMAKITPGIITSKILYILQGRKEEDIFSTFFRINTPNEIDGMAKKVGYQVENIKMLASNAQFAMILPLAILELLWIRLSLLSKNRNMRTSIVAILSRPT